jgi:hypothetical protein
LRYKKRNFQRVAEFLNGYTGQIEGAPAGPIWANAGIQINYNNNGI